METGFYSHSIYMAHDKGDFYYKMHMNDGTMISIGDTETSKQYKESTYSELVEMDRLIMTQDPIKIANEDNHEYLMFDQEYIDRFLSIVNNK